MSEVVISDATIASIDAISDYTGVMCASYDGTTYTVDIKTDRGGFTGTSTTSYDLAAQDAETAATA